ncbi:DUF6082 family protein [Streptomyces sp. NPDC094447]|uniref:DUF6082 family protein n=1 Tax=Streptomyces sp. NPDC094447 TaxID=3366062 RepID=UPI00380A2F90
MKISSAILIAAGTLALGILDTGRRHRETAERAERHHRETTERAERHHQETEELTALHHRQRLELDTARMHQTLLNAIANDPAQWEIWTRDGRSPEQCGQMVKINQQISLTQLRFSLGQITRPELHVQARSLMEREAVRNFWTETRDFRAAETQNETTRQFIAVLDGECTAAYRKAEADAKAPA